MGRRVLRYRWAISALVLLGVAPTLTLLNWPGSAPTTSTPTIPAEFATFSMFTSHAEDRPAGRAIALFETGSWEVGVSYQAIVVGADRDTYRQLDGGRADLWTDRPLLLSPDGTQVLRSRANAGPDEFELVDLRTGQAALRHGVRWTPAQRINGVERDALLAWSPDGRYVAYLIHAAPFDDPHSAPGPERQLAILDLTLDRAVLFGDLTDVAGAAFAPDSRRLAVAIAAVLTNPGVPVTDRSAGVDPSATAGGITMSVEGARLGTWANPLGWASVDVRSALSTTATVMAWSPDGATLAVATANRCGPHSNMTGGGGPLTLTAFVDMTTGQPLTPQPSMPCMSPLGWRSATTLVGEEIRADGGFGLAEASLTGGKQTAISHFSYGHGCELVGQCDVWRVQLATNLLGTVGIRAASYADRGPWVAIVHMGIPALAALLVGYALLRFILWRRRSRRPSSPIPPSPAAPVGAGAVSGPQ